MKACTIRKTNIRSEFNALVIQKKNYCLLAADLDHNLHCWVIPRWLGRVFQEKAFTLQPAKTYRHCQGGCWLRGSELALGSSHNGSLSYLHRSLLQMLPEPQAG